MGYKYYGKVNGKTVRGPIEASSMDSAIAVVAKHYGLGAATCSTSADVVQLQSGANYVEITKIGTTAKRAARVECC